MTCYCASLHVVLHITAFTVVLIWKIYFNSGVCSSNLQIDFNSLRMQNYYIKLKMLPWCLLRLSSPTGFPSLAWGWETVRDFCSALPLPLGLLSQFPYFAFSQYQRHQHFARATLVSTLLVSRVASCLKCLGYSHTHCSATQWSHKRRFFKVETLGLICVTVLYSW